MKPLSINIRRLREKKGLSQHELADLLGITQQAVGSWEKDGSVPGNRSLEKLTMILDVSRSELFGEPKGKSVQIPVLSSVVTESSVSSITGIISYIEITSSLASQGEFFALQVKDNSMSPEIKAGDVVIVRKQNNVDSDDIAIVLINGNEATIKQIQKKC